MLSQKIHSDIYRDDNRILFKQAKALTDQHSEQIVTTFYRTLSEYRETAVFLTTELVESRLKNSMRHWLLSIFDDALSGDFTTYSEQQRMIGEVHARIKIPMHIVNFGVDNIKQQFFKILARQNNPDSMVLFNFILRAIDLAAIIFNDVYLSNAITDGKNEQSLRQYYINNNLTLEFEQSRSDLLHWHRRILTQLYFPYPKLKHHQIIPLTDSKFGLWIEHRAALLLYNQNEIHKLKTRLEQIDSMLDRLLNLNQQSAWGQLAQEIEDLNTLISDTDQLLQQAAKEITKLENNKDSLTRMFTRRYLPSIIQHEIRYCLKNNTNLGIIIVDIDFFKRINEQYGHSIGDAILSQTANLLSKSIRNYDHIFRYDGEEFLIIINNTDEKNCLSMAESIRRTIQRNRFADLPMIQNQVTISLGVAIFDKHPDYEQLIRRACQALYAAKENGRNRVELYRNQI